MVANKVIVLLYYFLRELKNSSFVSCLRAAYHPGRRVLTANAKDESNARLTSNAPRGFVIVQYMLTSRRGHFVHCHFHAH